MLVHQRGPTANRSEEVMSILWIDMAPHHLTNYILIASPYQGLGISTCL